MGQRLVITIHAFDEDIAKIYYHWSAYTYCALCQVIDILDSSDWELCKTKDELILNITKLLEKRGGGIDGGVGSEEYKHFLEKYKDHKFKKDPDRSQGLIAITEREMEAMQNWSEGDIVLDFDEQIIRDFVWSAYEEKDSLLDFISDLDDYYKEALENAKEIYVNPECFSFDEAVELKNKIEEDDDFYRFQNKYFMTIR